MNRYKCYKCSQAVTMHFQTNFQLFSTKTIEKVLQNYKYYSTRLILNINAMLNKKMQFLFILSLNKILHNNTKYLPS